MLFLVFFIVVALLVALKGNKKFILFFMAFYPVLPDYFAIELGGGLPLLKASRILLLILMLCVCFIIKNTSDQTTIESYRFILAVVYIFCGKNFSKWILCTEFICGNQY